MSPLIIAAVRMLQKAEGVEYVKLHGDLMHEVDGELGASIIIKAKTGHTQTFLSLSDAEKIIKFPTGGFFTVNYLHDLLKLDDPETFLKDEG